MAVHAPLPSKISLKAKNRQDVVDLITTIEDIESGWLQSKYSEHIEDFFYLNDGKASERVLRGLQTVLRDERHCEASATAKAQTSGTQGKRLFSVQSLLLSVSWLVGSKNLSKLRELIRPERKAKRFESPDVLSILSAVGADNDIIVKHFRGGFANFEFSTIMISKKGE